MVAEMIENPVVKELPAEPKRIGRFGWSEEHKSCLREFWILPNGQAVRLLRNFLLGKELLNVSICEPGQWERLKWTSESETPTSDWICGRWEDLGTV